MRFLRGKPGSLGHVSFIRIFPSLLRHRVRWPCYSRCDVFPNVSKKPEHSCIRTFALLTSLSTLSGRLETWPTISIVNTTTHEGDIAAVSKVNYVKNLLFDVCFASNW